VQRIVSTAGRRADARGSAKNETLDILEEEVTRGRKRNDDGGHKERDVSEKTLECSVDRVKGGIITF
jgi:hypothetical protein